ncbi:MAG: tetraacyldisaccharide 4'-kinase, partial [Bacteroidota bacterium]
MAPISLLYGLGISIRNGLYSNGVLKGFKFNVPIISIGNLTVGGTGKSPHIEMLIRMLRPYLNIATLSRGYGRKSKGYIEIKKDHDAKIAGDEPLQFKRKFSDVLVTVAESRSLAIPKIMQRYPQTQTILLDDAFQHLEVIPSLNILLTEHSRLFTNDYLLPSGRLREWRS